MHLKWWLREQEKLINRSILIESAIFEFVNDTDTVHGIVHHVFHEGECIVIEMKRECRWRGASITLGLKPAFHFTKYLRF